MFTGLIETTAKITNFTQNSNGAVVRIECPFADEIKIGDSIAINGVCLTVTNINGTILSFDISKETLSVSAISSFKQGELVNLERAMKIGSRLDGHIVSGHIDGTGKISNISKDGFSYKFEITAPKGILKYVVKKGSIGINGISLTVSEVLETRFFIEIIPHTIEVTNLKTAKIGDIVNIETDILSKYVEKFLFFKQNNSSISLEMLKENGYL